MTGDAKYSFSVGQGSFLSKVWTGLQHAFLPAAAQSVQDGFQAQNAQSDSGCLSHLAALRAPPDARLKWNVHWNAKRLIDKQLGSGSACPGS